MHLSVEQFREGFRNGTLAFCMASAHAEISNEFLDAFSEKILKQDWRDVLSHGSRAQSMLGGDDSEDDLVAAIQVNYGVDVSDLPGLPFWQVVRRCAGNPKS